MGVSETKLDHQLDAERAVLGSLLVDPDILPQMLSAVRDSDFVEPVDRQIYQAARKLYREGRPADPITLRDQIGSQYTDYLVQLMEITPTSANWREYAAIMRQQSTLAKIRALADRLTVAVTLDDCRPALADMEQLLGDGTQVDAWTMREMMEDFLSAQDPDAPEPDYIKTGYEFLDEGIFIRPGSFVILGGEPSSGKTALGLTMAYNMAKTRKVGFFSLETDKEQIRDRMVSAAARINMGRVQHRRLSDADWSSVAALTADFSARELTTIRSAGMGMDEITGLTKAYGFDVIFVDYVQLIRPYTTRASRTEQMQAVSIALHTFAQKSGVTVVALAQLTRPERDKGQKKREPSMHDIKESGQFEQDADLILLLYEPPADDADEGNRVLKVGKNKQGRRGRWHLDFDGSTQTFALHKDPDAVRRQYAAAGQLAKSVRHAQSPGQVGFSEIHPSAEDEAVFAERGGEAT